MKSTALPFKTLEHQGQIMAYQIRLGDRQVVYGTKNMKRSHLRELFPHYRFCFVNQQHGAEIVEASPHVFSSADGHWTLKTNLALAVQTADCLPVFLMRNKAVCAVHAGWRGVVKKIVPRALECVPELKGLDLKVSIGPHIHKRYFVVGKDTALALQKSAGGASKAIHRREDGKYFVSLKEIVQSQILSKQAVCRYFFLDIDTFSSNLFHSFRQKAEKNKGQTAFIVRV